MMILNVEFTEQTDVYPVCMETTDISSEEWMVSEANKEELKQWRSQRLGNLSLESSDVITS